jgi:pimeloyl-ACP methyl ester carboxylesterase
LSGVIQNPVSVNNATFSSTYCRADEKVKLKVMQWQPIHPESDDPVIFVAGWVSTITGWTDFLRALAQKQPVYYIETREKKSAHIAIKNPKPNDFSIERIAKDLINICESLPVNMDRAILMGSSLGATALLEALKNNAMKARAAFLIGSNSDFKGPPILKYIINFPHPTYHILKYIVFWYLKKFRVDMKNEPEQFQRYNETIRSAHMQRLRLSAKSAINTKYQIWPDIDTIQIPVALAYAPTDKLHSKDNIRRMAESLPKGIAISCVSNKYMHSANILDDLHRFLNSIEN